MKKLFILLVITSFFVTVSQSQSRWNIGLQQGCVTNVAKFESGDEQANALFSNNPTKSLNLNVVFRYKLSEKFALQSGFNFTEFGFSYGIAKDYSLLKPWERSNDISAKTCISGIPVMAVMNTPKNCNNMRFVFGLGFTVRGIDNEWNDESYKDVVAYESGNASTTQIVSESRTVAAISPAATWMLGIEKVLRRGNSLGIMFTGNQGLTTIAESTVNYTVNNQNYSHTFINRGSYVSFALSYQFSAFGTRKAMRALK